MTRKIRTSCVKCETKLDVTSYEEEGGYCVTCKIWMVPESSRKELTSVRKYDNLLIQFYDDVTGKLTHTWSEYQMEKEE